MPFRLSKDAKGWFKHLLEDLDLDFDAYYLCLMAGLVANNSKEMEDSATTELLDKWPDKYSEQSKAILAHYLSTVIVKDMGVDLSDRRAVEMVIKQRITPDAAHRLLPKGMKEMNSYSNGGFEEILRWFEESPRVLEVFLPRYFERLGLELKNSEAQSS